MPWTYDNPPAVAQNWTDDEIRQCVDAANSVLEEGGSDEDAIFACIAAAGKREDENVEKKTFTAPLNFKAGEKGEFEAVFATLNVIDHDGDVTLPGAFGEQRVVIEPWNHNWAAPPVGKGMISERGGEGVVHGRFFLQTAAGQEHYEVAKALEDQQEFSYTFIIVGAEWGIHDGEEVRFLKKLDVVGVGQVTRGAGIATRLTAIKQQNPDETTSSEDETDPRGSRKSSAGDSPKRDGNLMAAIQAAEISMIYYGIESQGVNDGEKEV